MSIPPEIAAEARAVLSARREQSLSAQQTLRMQIAARAPHALDLEREIASTSAKLTQVILAGGDVTAQIERIKAFNLSKQQELTVCLGAAGFAPDALLPHPVCAECGDTGLRGGAVCDCVRAIQRKLLYDRLGSAAPIELCGFERFDLRYYSDQSSGTLGGFSARAIMARTFAACQKYAQEFSLASQSLLLTGGPGLGKTHLSLSIGRAVIDQGFDALYVPFTSLLTRLEAARFGKGSDEYLHYLSA
ncbi:MAG: ATP-binding protein, partial [Oscillospiraceae bacterium]